MKSFDRSRRDFLEKSLTVTASAAIAGASLLGASPALAGSASTASVPSCSVPKQLTPAEEIIENLRLLKNIWHGFPVDQLTHALQTATLAKRAGESPEIIVACLCHDMAKTVSAFNHEEMAAEMLKPYLNSDTYNMLKYHGVFQGRFFWDKIGRDPNAYKIYKGQRWYDLAMKFTDVYDRPAFKSGNNFDPLEKFIPTIHEVVGA